MGKTIRRVIVIIASLAMLTVILYPLLVENTASANSHPWADVYGFWYGDGLCSQYARQGYDTWENGWRWFSDIETLFTYNNPSLHYGLCYRGWPSTYYYNASASTPYGYLSGNAYFAFDGHANSHVLGYIGNLLADVPRSGDSNCYYVSNLRNMDDMKFALLKGCSTAANTYGDGRHLAWEFRCDRGVDTVVAFTGNIVYQYGNYYPGHVFIQEFSRASQLWQFTVGDACAWAKTEVYRRCGSNYQGYNSLSIWGNANNYIYIPGDGVNEGRP